MIKRIGLLFLIGFFAAPVLLFAQQDGKKAAKTALERLLQLEGFSATYRGISTTSEMRPEIYIAYAKPGKLFMRVPAMGFTAAHDQAEIRIQSQANGQSSGVIMPLSEVRQVTAEAHAGFATLSWLDMADPKTDPMNPSLSLDLGERTLNIGISFGASVEPFSWISLLAQKDVRVEEEDGKWKGSLSAREGGEYVYWISKKTGILERMIHQKDGKAIREIELAELKTEAPDESIFSSVFSDSVSPERFGSSPSQKAQYLIGLYDGIQTALLRDTLPRWKTLTDENRKQLAVAVSSYWMTVFKNILLDQKGNLEKALADPKLLEEVNRVAGNKTEYEKFVTSLPTEQTGDAKKLWADQVLGIVGYGLLDPFAGWTRDRYIIPAKEKIEGEGPKHGLEKNDQDLLLTLIALPIIDSCYVAAEPIVLPKLAPMIEKAAANLEG